MRRGIETRWARGRLNKTKESRENVLEEHITLATNSSLTGVRISRVEFYHPRWRILRSVCVLVH